MAAEDEVDPMRDLTSEARTAELRLSIDAGFVHHRKIQPVLGTNGMEFVNAAIERVPDLPDYVRQPQIDRIYSEHLLTYCSATDVPTLGQWLSGSEHALFCSVEKLLPSPAVYDQPRTTSEVHLRGRSDKRVLLEYSTARIAADTTRMQLAKGYELAVIAQFADREGDLLTFSPLVIGAPWLSDSEVVPNAMWLAWDFGEIYPEDIDELAKIRDVEAPKDIGVMDQISEHAFKHCLAEILGERASKDWGGEQSDLYSTHVHLNAKRTSAAFVLKGPGGGFRPMTLNRLGKNNDQIVRFANEPANLLVVQHCHDISQDVRHRCAPTRFSPGAPAVATA